MMKHTVFSILLAVLFCLGGAWDAAVSDGAVLQSRNPPPQESFQPIVSPSETMEAAIRYLSGTIHTSNSPWAAELKNGELLIAPLDKSSAYGINTWHFTAGHLSAGRLLPLCEFYVDDQGWIWKATQFEVSLLGNFTGQYDFNFTAPDAHMARMTYSEGGHFYPNPPVAITTEEAIRYLQIASEKNLRQHISPAAEPYAFIVDEIGGDVTLGIWKIRLGENRPDQFVTAYHVAVYSTGEIKLMDILTGEYKTIWR